MDTDLLSRISALARVPEHSVALMRAVSGGEPFVEDGYLFLTGGDWLMAVGYPLKGEYGDRAFEAALRRALARVPEPGPGGMVRCWAVGPALPPRLDSHILERDRFFTLDAAASVPARLRGPLRRAASVLRVEEGTAFTAAHRRLWTEFLERAERGARQGRPAMSDNVRALYAATPDALAKAGGDLRLLSAWDGEGRLAACLLLDHSPDAFLSYVLGAHSRANYVPHATDLLFAAMLDIARGEGKRCVHLGIGVNEGIERFKRKWGGKPDLPYVMAAWEQPVAAPGGEAPGGAPDSTRALALALMRAAAADEPGPDERPPEQRPYAMLWEVEKNGRRSWIGGSAHFFRYSFESSLIRLFRGVDTVLFEGPLDEEAMRSVSRHGERPPAGQTPLIDLLTEEEVRRLERVVRGPEGPVARWLNMEWAGRPDVRRCLRSTRYWYAFFSLWSDFLERLGWRCSVDMEAYRLALRMGRGVVAMETIEEQKATLDAVPLERILRFLRGCSGWGAMARGNRRAYLSGDLEGMMGSSAEFPTRTEQVIGTRDRRFLERMLPWLEGGRCAVFVGTAHMVNLRRMLAAEGFSVRHTPRGVWPKLCRALRGRAEVRW